MTIVTVTKQDHAIKDRAVLLLLGGDKRDRTAGLLNAIQALSQLSYTPINFQYYAELHCNYTYPVI